MQHLSDKIKLHPSTDCMKTIIRQIITLILVAFVWSNSLCQVRYTSISDTSNVHQLIVSSQVFWDNLPKPAGPVNDFEKIFSAKQNQLLGNKLRLFKAETGLEIAIVTLDSLCTSKEKFDDLALHIFNTWGIGEKEKDNGILISISRGHRKMRITNGYGIGKILSDRETKTIIENYFIPDFKKGEYYTGTLTGLTELTKLLRTKNKQIDKRKK
jgi:uncharacterized protein